MKTPLLCTLLLASGLLTGGVQQSAAQTLTEKSVWSAETDPATFLFSGFAVHLRVKPSFSENWVLGAGTYAMDLPSLMVDLNSENKGKGWKVRIDGAFSLFSEYYFREANTGSFIGVQAGFQNYRLTNKQTGSKGVSYNLLVLMPSAGYTWRPWDGSFYLKPWLGLGWVPKLSGRTTLGTQQYDLAPVTAFATLHTGFTF